MKQVLEAKDLKPWQTYLVLAKRWTGKEPGVTELIVDDAVWSLADWNGSSFVVNDEYGHELQFESLRVVYELAKTHTEFERGFTGIITAIRLPEERHRGGNYESATAQQRQACGGVH